MVKKYLSLFFIFFFLTQFSVYANELSLMEGDVIGETEIIEDSSTAYIEAATRSRFGHIGVVFKYNGELKVFEEYPPQAQIVTVDEFLNRSPGKFAVIRNPKALTSDQLETMKSVALNLVENEYPYNYSQIKNDSSMNCSEFVNFVFSKIGFTLGKVETIGKLHLKSFIGHPWRLWKMGNPDISKNDLVITPKSIMQTPGWIKVAGVLNPNDNLSDRELYRQWKSENAIHDIAREWMLFEWQIKLMSWF